MRSFRKGTMLAALSLATLLSVGVATASAHGRPGQGAAPAVAESA